MMPGRAARTEAIEHAEVHMQVRLAWLHIRLGIPLVVGAATDPL
jgi:hypothetical protein